ncbi:MAG: aldo/keto reductase [Pseudomonadota bacterium]
MKYRDFGKTGLQISELLFGGGAVGGLLINAPEETRLAALERATSAGINWIDTAASYGQGQSESTLGRLLPQLEQSPYISTKFTINTQSSASIFEQIEVSVAASLERLQRDQVTLLQLHNPIGPESRGRMLGEDEVLGAGGVLDSLEKLREQGLFEHFGITALGKPPSVLRVIESGRIASAQVYYNLLNPSAGQALPTNYPVYDFSGVLQACVDHGKPQGPLPLTLVHVVFGHCMPSATF